MKRIQLFEFEDQSWFPDWLRDRMTRFIVTMHKLLGSAPVLAQLIDKGLKRAPAHRILDLCSGSGGPMLEVYEILRRDYGYESLELTLSDLYPHQQTAEQINSEDGTHISYIQTPIDATHIDEDHVGIRTMVCSMHHMPPHVAKDILKDAKNARQPISIFEISDNSFPKWLWWTAIPINFLMTFFVTPLIRPMSWQQIVFTYLIPILPLLIAWDGAVSNARTYTLEDIEILLQDLRGDDYEWQKGIIEGKAGNKLFLLGLPKV